MIRQILCVPAQEDGIETGGKGKGMNYKHYRKQGETQHTICLKKYLLNTDWRPLLVAVNALNKEQNQNNATIMRSLSCSIPRQENKGEE